MAASRSESELLRALIDTVPTVVAYCDASLHCRFTNRAYERWFGGSPEAMIGRHIRELLGPIYERNLPYMQRALAGEMQEFEREIPNPSGGPPRHGLETYVPDWIDGTVCGFFALVTDVTERKTFATAAQRATKARDDLLGIVAHDLRNPLSTIVVAANLVRRSHTSSDAQMQMIERAAKRMDHLIEELLDVTRIEAGRLSIDAARVDSRELVSEVVTSQRTIATAASLALELDVSQDLPDVWADRNRLLQIFENLMSNALKFTHAGRITVGARPSNGEVVFSVADTGAGIAPDALPSVFDRFWQAARADRRGAGLGLPIVKGLVEAHGGRIWVESAVQRGTTFYFTMPVALAPELSQTPRMTA